MKRILCSLFLLSHALLVNAQSADDIITNYINALGGPEKLSALKTIKMTGSLTVQGMGIEVTVTASHGIGSRTDINVPGMGEGFQIYTPSKGWSYLPFQGQTSVEEMTEDQLKGGQTQLDLQGQLYNYKEKGNTVELLGKETVDGMDCYKLKVQLAYGRINTFFIDSKNYYRVRTIATVEGKEIETNYSNFKKTEDGYVYPFSQSNPNGTIEFSTIEVNKPVDVTIFKA